MSRGEIVIVVHGAPQAAEAGKDSAAAQSVLRVLLEELPVSQAAKLAARITGIGRNEVYELALAMSKARE
jgi:16S rRNA (cytidine1402-2'-O)-methyltransferase